jgi:putative DNA primase/helicase
LDKDHWLLNMMNGTIDLHTGQLRPHRREDLITKLCPVHYDPLAKCPRWTTFLKEIFAPHPDIIPYTQRAVGYSLTGDTREECLFFCIGPGRNGKGTFIRTLQAMPGDYASTADFATFIAGRDERGPRDDIANMRGRRFVISQEVREGAPLAESLVKWLTGGDVVRARNLYQRSTEWLPTHHLWLAANRKVVFGQVDERFDRKEHHGQCREEAADNRGNASVSVPPPTYPTVGLTPRPTPKDCQRACCVSVPSL